MRDHDGRDAITDVPGLKVGHWTNRRAATGCTVVLPPEGTVGGVDVRGGAPGTRETDALRPGTIARTVHAVVLAGGSAFGLDAATGVMRYLEEQGAGHRFGGATIPVATAAVIFDLNLGSSRIRPTADAGYRAARAAKGGRVAQGSIGAGTGATVAKTGGVERCLKGGVGTASERGPGGLIVAALAVANAAGEIVDPRSGRVIAGPRADGRGFLDSIELIRSGEPAGAPPGGNTSLAVVATNARLAKEQANRLASLAHDGLARAIRPAHTLVDGDTVFALATGALGSVEKDACRALEALAPRAVERAIVNAVVQATGLAGVPSAREWAARGRRATRRRPAPRLRTPNRGAR